MPLPYPPFKAKVIEPLPVTTREEREEVIVQAGFNLFKVGSEQVSIDLLTDSGTGAMSAAQWAAAIQGDEACAGSPSFRLFERAVRTITHMQHVLPVHQGRAAERIVFDALVSPGDIVPSNSASDTTRANIERLGGTVLHLPHPSSADPLSDAPFKGDIDLDRLTRVLDEHPGKVPLVILTLTSDAAGGQPVQPSNVEQAARLCTARGVPLWIDAARYAENAALVIARDPLSRGYSPQRVAAELFAPASGVIMSCKKDGNAHVGGFVACNSARLATQLGELLIATEGYLTYGGLAGRDLAAIAVGLQETLEPAYLAHRLGQVRYLHDLLKQAGIPVVRPAGGHAVFVDAGALLPQIPPEQLPGQALACALYVEGGIRACEIGTLMFGGGDAPPVVARELVRLAVPRRVYETAHLDHVGRTLAAIAERPGELSGLEVVEGDGPLRRFTARLRPVPHARAGVLRAVPS